jgi:hypothetical protein
VVEVLSAAHVVVHGEAGGEVADAATDLDRVLDDVETEDRGGACGWVEEAEEGADGGALPRAVRAEEAEELTLLDLQINGGERLDLAGAAVVLGKCACLNGE